jgi:hypothetical protein
MKRLRSVGYLSLSLAILLPALAQARQTIQAKKAIRSVDLQPSPDAEVVFPKIKLAYNDDGTVVLSGRGTAKAGVGPAGFDYSVDKKTGVYSTKRLSVDRMQKLLSESQDPRAKKLSGTPGVPVRPHGPESQNGVTAAVAPGEYAVYLTVVAKDPVFIELARTTTALQWYVYPVGSVSWTAYDDSCWCNPESIINTHWYTSYCVYGAPWYEGSSLVCNYNEAEYYNWDFVFDSLSTYVAQVVLACGRNDAYFEYGWDHQDGGEGSSLINGTVFWF